MGAFASKGEKHRIHLPAEEVQCLDGESAWVDVRPAVGVGTYRRMQEQASDIGQLVVFLKESVLAWSWEVDLSPENIDDLHIEILGFLGEKLAPFIRNGDEPPPEESSPATEAS